MTLRALFHRTLRHNSTGLGLSAATRHVTRLYPAPHWSVKNFKYESLSCLQSLNQSECETNSGDGCVCVGGGGDWGGEGGGGRGGSISASPCSRCLSAKLYQQTHTYCSNFIILLNEYVCFINKYFEMQSGQFSNQQRT